MRQSFQDWADQTQVGGKHHRMNQMVDPAWVLSEIRFELAPNGADAEKVTNLNTLRIFSPIHMNKFLLVPCLCLPLLVSGCASYQRVTDPTTQKVYYTKDLHDRGNGAVVFKDAATGEKVTLQNSEVKKIKRSEFKQAVPNN
jgi:hypothetical protein